ncbi:MAG TPA: DUF1993 domain-containing protein [Steroidobacteraceae bacterium]|nr:DUF1993 domain-containing protein [Steroidobacteraceae bacterium]
MNISMHNASTGVFARVLRNLSTILEKAEQWTAARGIDPNAILQSRLAPDMFTFTRQIQICSDNAKGAAARLAGMTPPSFEDNEASFAELKARVAKTIAFLESVPAASFAGAEDRPIKLMLGPPGKQTERNFTGLDYLMGFATPNVYFHYSMAYALLRHNGLDIGKKDYIG